ncbi:MAG: COX15/CtaA family protein [Planctomycetaceae bacterium]
MSVQHENVHPVVRKLATATCLVALLPISMGALVTTLNAGMAFADWPSSDGHNMLLYPWFSDFAANPDKFTEHGHRLAGMLIGFVSVCLALASYCLDRSWVKWFTTAILLSVIAQGALGGARVLLDRQLLAMLHSVTGAAFFGLCVVFRLMCSPKWSDWRQQRDERIGPLFASLVAITPVIILGQYVLGGALRHFHTMLDEHLAGAAIVTLSASLSAFGLMRSQNSLLRRSGLMIVVTLLLQVMLGAGSYLTKLGLPQIGYVAVVGSLSQTVTCSMHTVFGMFLLSSSVVAATSLAILYRAGCLAGLQIELPAVGNRGTVA